ncbi:tRNA pseudouridine(38-40) synthase TruA [Pedobacter sp. L105]|uniref:tRNA pseudouridine(38-40) synthase TruA n=1 Tax=Pedobacter sp. L105 TaxID=1641871 RepID=UPI0020B1784A|nr:tRNA pseudouridine(38-40) synthase TruA [Pedobacter sp. L105]
MLIGKKYFCSQLNTQRFFLELSYDGTAYHGWQTQPNSVTVQQELDRALSVYFRQPVITLGCGRTDTGVHASQFFAHMDLVDINESAAKNAVGSINALLPYAIAIKRIFKVADTAHARFDATSRSYEYHFHFHKDPFKLNRSWLYKTRLDIALMNTAAATLFNYTDFTSFSKSNTSTATNNCKITQAEFQETEGGLIFKISADRFLRNMVRAIVGTLVLAGRHEIDLLQFADIITSKNRSNAGQSVPACGLYLVNVVYPFVN